VPGRGGYRTSGGMGMGPPIVGRMPPPQVSATAMGMGGDGPYPRAPPPMGGDVREI
jgi:hypothetical protein